MPKPPTTSDEMQRLADAAHLAATEGYIDPPEICSKLAARREAQFFTEAARSLRAREREVAELRDEVRTLERERNRAHEELRRWRDGRAGRAPCCEAAVQVAELQNAVLLLHHYFYAGTGYERYGEPSKCEALAEKVDELAKLAEED